jgi:hypothetical protein
MKADCVGTLRLNRKVIPKIAKEKPRKGKVIAQHSASVSVLKWCDKKKRVTMISTYHGD